MVLPTKLIVLIFFGIIGNGVNCEETTIELAELVEFIEDLIETEFMPESKTVGMGFSIIWLNASGDGNNLKYANGFGYRDRELNSLATNKTLFPIGSVTKNIVATMIIKILNQKFPALGESVTEVPIIQLMPTINLTLSDRYRTESISFRDLLSHRSCLSSHLIGVIFGAINDTQDYLYRTRFESEVCPFRSTYFYNNAMYTLAGDLISKISGQPFEQLFRDFLDELEMTDSRLIDLNEDLALVQNLVHGYYTDNDDNLVKSNLKTLNSAAIVNPAGGLLSTPEDMIKYVAFHLNNGLVGDRQVVPKDVLAWHKKPSVSVGDNQGYGLGFLLTYVPGKDPVYFHNGFWSPHASMLIILPQLNVGIFCSSNGPGELTPLGAQDKLFGKIIQFIAQSKSTNLPKLSVKNFASSHFLQNAMPQFNSPAPVQLKSAKICNADIVGTFGNILDESFEIYRADDAEQTLTIKYGQFGLGTLTEISDCEYKINWTSDVNVHFSCWSDGMDLTQILRLSDDALIWELAVGAEYIYVRNLTVGQFPVIPYDPDSCVADSYYG